MSETITNLEKNFACHKFSLFFVDENKIRYTVWVNFFYRFYSKEPKACIFLDFYPIKQRHRMFRLIMNQDDINDHINRDILNNVTEKRNVMIQVKQILERVKFIIGINFRKPVLCSFAYSQLGYKYYLSNTTNIEESKGGGLLKKAPIHKTLIGHFPKRIGNNMYTIFSIY